MCLELRISRLMEIKPTKKTLTKILISTDNQHTESAKSALESLELSTIDHNDTESYGNRVNGRMTCSSKLSVTPQKILPNNKSSRSPLATNNSINEGTDQVNVFSGDDTAEKAKRMK